MTVRTYIINYNVVVFHDQVRRQVSQGSHCRGSYTHELISPDSAIDLLVTSQSGVWCKRTGVSHLVVKLHSPYRCRLVRLIPYACSPSIAGSVLTVVVKECIVVFGSDCAPRPILGDGRSLSTSVVSLELNSRVYRVCVQILVAFHPA